MDEQTLRRRLKDHEDAFIERKAKGSSEDIRRTLVAFANSLSDEQIGILFLGVNDSGTICGIDNTDDRQQDVRRNAEGCYPPIAHTCRVFQEEGKHIVAVIVPASNNQPHFTGPAYVRVGSSSVVASEHKFHELIDSRNSIAKALMKERDQKRKVTIDYWLDSHDPLTGTCRALSDVIECTSLYATFRTDRGDTVSVSLSRVNLSKNPHNNTLMVSWST